MAQGDGSWSKLSLHRDVWTLAPRAQCLEKEKKNYFNLLLPITTCSGKKGLKDKEKSDAQIDEEARAKVTFVENVNHS